MLADGPAVRTFLFEDTANPKMPALLETIEVRIVYKIFGTLTPSPAAETNVDNLDGSRDDYFGE
jgi:hypothetical protein